MDFIFGNNFKGDEMKHPIMPSWFNSSWNADFCTKPFSPSSLINLSIICKVRNKRGISCEGLKRRKTLQFSWTKTTLETWNERLDLTSRVLAGPCLWNNNKEFCRYHHPISNYYWCCRWSVFVFLETKFLSNRTEGEHSEWISLQQFSSGLKAKNTRLIVSESQPWASKGC